MSTEDRLTAALEEIRQRRAITQELCGDGSEYINRLYRSAEDVPWLLRALDAVLALAAKLEPQASPSSALEEDRMWIRQECSDMIRLAITRELLGEENGDAWLQVA